MLAIQGPPGTGKTHTAAEMIVALVRAGKRVGVTGMSHAVVRNPLTMVVACVRELGVDCRVGAKVNALRGDGAIVCASRRTTRRWRRG